MTSNQIALKPFVTRLAQREGMSYEQMVQTQAAGLAEVPEDQFTQDAQVRGSADLARGLNLKASDVAEMKADFARAGVKPRVIDGIVSMMAVTALALEPTAAVGLDSAMRLLLMDEKPLPASAVQDGRLDLQPAMARIAQELGTDVPGLLARTAEEYKAATPEQLGGERIDAILKTASIFPVVPCANTNFPTLMAAEKIAAAMTATS